MLPVIGLSTYRESARWGVWDQPADLLPAQYADVVLAAGGVPVLLPTPAAVSPEQLHQAAADVVRRLDGFVISGGADVDPARYADQAHPLTAGWRPERDAWEIALLAAAELIALPVLGVCRGMQVMAVAAGGTLHQHTPDRVGDERHSPGADAFGRMEVSVARGSRLGALVGDHVSANCHHHQDVADHPGFRPVATASDGTLEAMETEGPRFCVAVQWHPETAADVGLLAGLVAAAMTFRTDRGCGQDS